MRTIVCGLDEAGYGPLLGPLVVASSIFLVNENPEANMWHRLQDSVGKSKKGLGNRILICDSKKAYSRMSGLGHLERTVRAFLDQLHLKKADKEAYFSSILPVISNDLTRQIEKYPWYTPLYSDFLPTINQGISDVLTKNMKQEEIEFVDFRCLCIDVEEFNRAIKLTENKASVVTTSILNLIQQIISLAIFCAAKKIVILCDRLGGRMYYEDLLKTIPNFTVFNVQESGIISEYKLISDRKTNRELNIQFEVGADDKHLPVALASMTAKYIREKVMQHMNEYFIKLQPGLKPTAGYWTDGWRFLEDLEDVTLEKASIEREDLVRIK